MGRSAEVQPTWAHLSINGDRLWFGRPRRRTARLRFEPFGLVVVDRAGETALAWSDHKESDERRSGWSCVAQAGGETNRPRVAVTREDVPADPYALPMERTWVVKMPLLTVRFAMFEAAAIVRWAVLEPNARNGFAQPEKLRRVIGELQTAPMFERPFPTTRLMGDKHDLDRVILRCLENDGVRFIYGRPVRGRPWPAPEEFVEPVIAGLPAWVRPRVAPEQIVERVGRFLGIRPWPFDLLADEGPPDARPRSGGEDTS